MILDRVLRFMFPAGVPLDDWIVYSAAGVERIEGWNTAKLGPQPTPAEIAAAELPAAKAAAISSNRAECSSRIFERYPAGRQLSASFGLYDSANVATMVDWIAANVAAENTAADAIEAATTVDEVEAVTVAWPV